MSLLRAVEENADIETVTNLIDQKADINRQDITGSTPLHAAVRKSDNLDYVHILIENNADMQKTDAYCKTPLHYAVQEGNFEMVRLLIDNKADVDNISCHSKIKDPVAFWTGAECIVEKEKKKCPEQKRKEKEVLEVLKRAFLQRFIGKLLSYGICSLEELHRRDIHHIFAGVSREQQKRLKDLTMAAIAWKRRAMACKVFGLSFVVFLTPALFIMLTMWSLAEKAQYALAFCISCQINASFAVKVTAFSLFVLVQLHRKHSAIVFACTLFPTAVVAMHGYVLAWQLKLDAKDELIQRRAEELKHQKKELDDLEAAFQRELKKKRAAKQAVLKVTSYACSAVAAAYTGGATLILQILSECLSMLAASMPSITKMAPKNLFMPGFSSTEQSTGSVWMITLGMMSMLAFFLHRAVPFYKRKRHCLVNHRQPCMHSSVDKVVVAVFDPLVDISDRLQEAFHATSQNIGERLWLAWTVSSDLFIKLRAAALGAALALGVSSVLLQPERLLHIAGASKEALDMLSFAGGCCSATNFIMPLWKTSDIHSSGLGEIIIHMIMVIPMLGHLPDAIGDRAWFVMLPVVASIFSFVAQQVALMTAEEHKRDETQKWVSEAIESHRKAAFQLGLETRAVQRENAGSCTLM